MFQGWRARTCAFPRTDPPRPVRGASGCGAALPWSQIRAVLAVPTAGSLAPINVRLNGFPHGLAKRAARSEFSLQGSGLSNGQDFAKQGQPGRRWDLLGMALPGASPVALQRRPCSAGSADTRWPGPLRKELPEELGSAPATLSLRRLEHEHLFPPATSFKTKTCFHLITAASWGTFSFRFFKGFCFCFCFKYHTNSQG